MTGLLLLLFSCFTPAQEGKLLPPGAQPAAPTVQAVDALESELLALAKEYNSARLSYDKRLDELRKQGEAKPESKVEHPSVAFWPRIEPLAQRGSAGARLWMALQFGNAHPALPVAERDKAWRTELLAAVDAGAKLPLARDIARSFTVLYLDAPPLLVDEAIESFVKQAAERELAADALYRASIAKRRGAPTLASPKAAEFAKRLAAEYADTAALRQAKGEADVGLAIGKQAPDFTAKDADGASFKLSEYRGKVVVLDFWGFW